MRLCSARISSSGSRIRFDRHEHVDSVAPKEAVPIELHRPSALGCLSEALFGDRPECDRRNLALLRHQAKARERGLAVGIVDDRQSPETAQIVVTPIVGCDRGVDRDDRARGARILGREGQRAYPAHAVSNHERPRRRILCDETRKVVGVLQRSVLSAAAPIRCRRGRAGRARAGESPSRASRRRAVATTRRWPNCREAARSCASAPGFHSR